MVETMVGYIENKNHGIDCFYCMFNVKAQFFYEKLWVEIIHSFIKWNFDINVWVISN